MEKYMNVMIEVESLIEGGTFQEGARLPSIRQLAERFHVSKSTVIRALQELEKRHIIYAVPKSGYYLIKNEKKQEREQTGIIDFAASAPTLIFFRTATFSIASTKPLICIKMICSFTARRRGFRL